jgi:hypothetical protein
MSAPLLKVVLTRHDWDCGVATLAMLTGVSYEEVLAAAARLAAVERGLYLTEMRKIAEELDVPLVLKRKGRYNPQTATGILHVSDVKRAKYHVVILWEGYVIETDGSIWRVDTYLAAEKWKANSLLVKE